MLAFHVVIPARFASTRLPGKPLLEIGGKPMVVRVAEQAAQSGAKQIIIATDHAPILSAVAAHGFQACLTRADHSSGTDRIAEVVAQQGWADDTLVVNVQGDEPLIPPALIRAVAQHLHDHPECAIATACHPIHDEASMRNPNIVKAVLDKDGNALYFSRAPIPYLRDAFATNQSLPPARGKARMGVEPLDDAASTPSRAGVVGASAPYNPGLPLAGVTLMEPLANRLSPQAGKSLVIPPHGGGNNSALRHIGVYAYRVSFLRAFGQLAPAAIEQIEALEQLRALWHGYKIGVTVTQDAPPGGVDTQADLIAARTLFESSLTQGAKT